jgi:Pro-kumamolisin, activation domain
LRYRVWGAAAGMALVVLAVAAPAAPAGSAASAAQSQAHTVALPGEVPAVPSGATRLGPLAASRMLHLTVGLTGADPAGLADEVAAVSTPGSPEYRHFLTAAQYAASFGPTAAEVHQVSAALRGEGLQVGTPSLGSSLLPVTGTAHTISAAFGTPLEGLRLHGGTSSFVNTAAPHIPAALAGDVTGVVGLSGLSQERSMLLRHAQSTAGSPAQSPAPTPSGSHALTPHQAGPQACAAASDIASEDTSYTSTQLADDYGLSTLFAQGRSGLGETIGVVEFEEFSQSDINAFEACYGLDNPIRVVTVDGSPGGPAEGSGEAALDIELAAVNAPSASIVVYESPNPVNESASIDMLNTIASDDQAQVITTSWGECEPENGTTVADQENTVFERMAVQGQTMVAAAGDDGSEDCYDPEGGDQDTELAVDDPGSQPDVLSVGGTTLVDGSVATQSVWNDCEGSRESFCSVSGGAGGGGYSVDWPRPSWQPTTVGGSSAPNQRMVPDLSISADPADGVAIYFGGWTVFGGTSVAAPTIAGLLADTNQGCASRLGLVGPSLYAADNSDAAANFTDVTTGENDLTGSHGGDYPAGAGFDLATGLGTPEDQNLAIALQGGDGCPAVAGLSADSGPVSGAPALTITGGGLADASAVNFGPDGRGTIVSATETSLVVVPPSPQRAECVDVTVTNPQGTSAQSSADTYDFGNPSTCDGYRFVASDGGIFDFGSAQFYGSTGSTHLNKPIVGMAATPDGGGYWLVASDGGIFAYGDAQFYGSTGSIRLNKPIVGMAATPDGKGYWLVASDGGIFAFGSAQFYGSTGSIRLNKPIVGMAATPDGGGYWLVASDGGIFSYGDAQFYGSTGSTHLNKPIVGMASTSDGGYWLVASDGGIFAYGDAGFYGSTGSTHLNKPIVGMASTSDGGGYWLVASDGGIFAYGDAGFYGSTGSTRLNKPIVGMAAG